MGGEKYLQAYYQRQRKRLAAGTYLVPNDQPTGDLSVFAKCSDD